MIIFVHGGACPIRNEYTWALQPLGGAALVHVSIISIDHPGAGTLPALP